MSIYTEFAKEIHSRNNEKHIGICVGEITSLTPVNICIYYNGEPLNFTEFFNVKDLINGSYDVTEGELCVEEYPVKVGDKFICMSGQDNQSLYLIGKFESIKDLYIYLEE